VRAVTKVLAPLCVALLIGGASCSKTSDSAVPPPNIKLPSDPGGECKDPAADISGDVKGGNGVLAEPAGIDIVAAESKVAGGVLKTKLTFAGPVASVAAPTVIIDQGNPGEEVSFELRAAPTTKGGPWGLTLITWKGHVERSAPLVGVNVTVADKTVAFDIPTKDLPPIVTLLWNFGASSGDGEAALLDDCNNAVEQKPADPGTSTTSTTIAVADAKLGDEQAWSTTSKVTVYEVQAPPKVKKDLLVPPDAGFKLAVVDAKVCATDDKIDARTQNFSVKTTEDREYPVWSEPQPGADPGMAPVKSLPAGECIRGWITFQIPEGETVASVYYSGRSDGREAVVWKV